MRRSYYFGALCVALSCALLTIAFVKTRTAGQPDSSASPASPFEVERITLQEWGFEPKEINRGPGPFFLILENRGGFHDVEVSLIEESGHSRQKVPVTKNALTWKQRLELPPGAYLVKESGHPEWQCRITIGRN